MFTEVHIQTLAVVTVFVTALLGLLLLFAGFQNRSIRGPKIWGVAYLIGAVGALLLTARGRIPDVLSIEIANALVLLTFGLVWSGARMFDGRPVRPVLVAVPPILWIVACQIPVFGDNINVRIVGGSSLMALLLLATADEIWRGRREPLMSRWPTVIVLLAHAAAMLARIPTTYVSPFIDATSFTNGVAFTILSFGTLMFTVCFAFLLLNMTKERTELNHKIASLVDPLTGIANRRAFLLEGGALLKQHTPRREPLALLLFDLDRFKQINDRFGHALGDRVLRCFTETAARTLGPDVCLGRIGGEEFAALVPVGDVGEAIAVADRVRRHFEAEASILGDAELAPTVSVGLTLSLDLQTDIETLLAVADAALYRAKSAGRNRVEAADIAATPAPVVRAPSIIPIMRNRERLRVPRASNF